MLGNLRLLPDNATPRGGTQVWDKQGDQAGQHGIRDVVELGDAYPLRGIVQLFSGDMEKVAAGDDHGLHQVLAPARLRAARAA